MGWAIFKGNEGEVKDETPLGHDHADIWTEVVDGDDDDWCFMATFMHIVG